jgi:phytoene dehydrogenase-like protein
LVSKGLSVVVLEVNDYIGGRMKSKQIEGRSETNYIFEEGANWIHGYSDANPITALSKRVKGVKLV